MYLKKTQYILGLVIYAGQDTKVMQNYQKPQYKLSKVETFMNQSVLFILMLQLFFAMFAALVGFYQQNTPDNTWALYLDIVQYGKYELSLVDTDMQKN